MAPLLHKNILDRCRHVTDAFVTLLLTASVADPSVPKLLLITNLGKFQKFENKKVLMHPAMLKLQNTENVTRGGGGRGVGGDLRKRSRQPEYFTHSSFAGNL